MFWTEFWKMKSDANLIIFICCGDQLMADAFIACVVNKTEDEEIGDRKEKEEGSGEANAGAEVCRRR